MRSRSFIREKVVLLFALLFSPVVPAYAQQNITGISESPIPVVTGDLTFQTSVEPGTQTIMPELDPVILWPIGRKFLVESEFTASVDLVANGDHRCTRFVVADPLSARSGAESPRIVEVIADKDNTFKVPGQAKPIITMKPGEKILLRITSHFGGEQARDGSVHSFVVKKLRDLGWDVRRLKEGTQDYPLVAPEQTGEYLIECTVKCGRGHDDMNMKLVVRN